MLLANVLINWAQFMVRAVDLEGLLQKYVEENSLERADALYLLFTIGPEGAAKTLRARYGRSGALNSVLDDLKALGAEKASSYEKTTDTGEDLGSVIQDSFKRICLSLVVKSAKVRSATLSQNAREILYIISVMRPETINIEHLERFYKLLFRKTLTDHEFKSALDELIRCYLVQHVSEYGGYLEFPPYFEGLLGELEDVMPRVEVKVSWSKKEM